MKARFVVLLVFAAGSLAASVSPAYARALVVTRTDDPPPGACDADCSLREAIIAANTIVGPDRIVLPRLTPGVFELTIPGDDIFEGAAFSQPEVGDLDLTSEITIDGSQQVIEQQVINTGLFQMHGGSRVALRGLTVQGALGGFGGAIYNSGDLNIADTTVSGNAGGLAGGIFNEGNLSIVDSAVVSNFADDGAGIRNLGGAVSMVHTLVSMNEGNGGVGIANTFGTFTIRASVVSENISEGFAANSAAGGGVFNSGTLDISDSALSGNAVTGFDAKGGGIANLGQLTITHSTLSGNEADLDGGGIYNEGTTSLTNVTVAANTADADGFDDVGEGGGIAVAEGEVAMKASIVAGNTDGSQEGTELPDWMCENGAIFSEGFTVVGVINGCGFVPHVTDATGTLDAPRDAGLNELAYNGGPTPTHSLDFSSPAKDLHASSDPDCPGSADQRGVPRPQGSACDAGAYEFAVCGLSLVNVVGTNGPDTLQGTNGNDGVLALGAKDNVFGNGGDDALCGGSGNDRLFGGDGNDLLFGEGGKKDRCFGEVGTDTFHKSCEIKKQ